MKYRILLLLLFCLFMCNCSEEQLFEDLYNASAEETILLNNMTSNKMFLTDSLGVEYIEDLISLIPPDFSNNVYQEGGWNYWLDIVYPTYGPGIQYGNLCFFFASANVINYYWSSCRQGDEIFLYYLDQKYNNEIDFLNAYYYIVQNGITKNEAQDVVHTLWEYGLVRGIQYSTIFYDYQLDQAFQNGLAVVGLLNGTPLHAVMITKYKPNTYELGYYDSIYNHVVTASWNPTLFESLISY